MDCKLANDLKDRCVGVCRPEFLHSELANTVLQVLAQLKAGVRGVAADDSEEAESAHLP